MASKPFSHGAVQQAVHQMVNRTHLLGGTDKSASKGLFVTRACVSAWRVVTGGAGSWKLSEASQTSLGEGRTMTGMAASPHSVGMRDGGGSALPAAQTTRLITAPGRAIDASPCHMRVSAACRRGEW